MGNDCSNCVNERIDKKKQWDYDYNNMNIQQQPNNNLQRDASQQQRQQYANNDPYIPQQFNNNNQQIGDSQFNASNNFNKSQNNRQIVSPQNQNMYENGTQFNNQNQQQQNINHFSQNSYNLQNNQKNDFDKNSMVGANKQSSLNNIIDSSNSALQNLNISNQQLITSTNISKPTNQSFGGQQIQEKPIENSFNQQISALDQLVERGPIELEQGSIYSGQWRGDQREGFGKQYWPDGAVYEGYWNQDKAEGKGKFIHPNGDIYEGEWRDNKANGKGKYTHADGSIYDGDWRDDYKDGKGIETWANKSRYEGSYSQGKKHGQGRFFWFNGSSYNGNWSMDQLHGYGVYTWKDGRMYQGYWKENVMHGKGKYTWSDGRYYEGDYQNDKKHGFGVYAWIDHKRYEGYWYKGKQHGKGKYIYPTGQVKFVIYNYGKQKQVTQEEYNMISDEITEAEISFYFNRRDGEKSMNDNSVNHTEDIQISTQFKQSDWETRRPELAQSSEDTGQHNYFKNGFTKMQSDRILQNNQSQNDLGLRKDPTQQEKQIYKKESPKQYEQQNSQFILKQNSSAQNLNNIQQIQQNELNREHGSYTYLPPFQQQEQAFNKNSENIGYQIKNQKLNNQSQLQNTFVNENEIMRNQSNQDYQDSLLKVPVIRNVESQFQQGTESSQYAVVNEDQSQINQQMQRTSFKSQQAQKKKNQDLLSLSGKITQPVVQQQQFLNSKVQEGNRLSSPGGSYQQRQQY